MTLASAGTAYLAASSGAQDAHEADALGGSIFTHHWVAGLRGAADRDEDGLVTLVESYHFARAHTTRDSAVYVGQPQHPSFRLDIVGRDDIVLSDLRVGTAVVSVRWGVGSADLFDLRTGQHLAALERNPTTLVLPPGRYAVRRPSALGPEIAEFVVVADVPAAVQPDDFAPLNPAGWLAVKGNAVPSLHRLSPAATDLIIDLALVSRFSPSSTGDLHREVWNRISYQVGLSERLALTFRQTLPWAGDLGGLELAPLVSWRFGRAGGAELLAYGGFFELGAAFSERWTYEGLYGRTGGGADVRVALTDTVRLAGSGFGSAPVFGYEDLPDSLFEGAERGTAGGLGLGVELQIGANVTLSPATSLTLSQELDGGPVWWLGDGLRRAGRRMPLLRIAFSRGFTTLDAGLSVGVPLGAPSTPPLQEVWVGYTHVGSLGVER